MKYVKDHTGFHIVPNEQAVASTTYTYNLTNHDDASEVLMHLMDMQASQWDFLHFGSNLGLANSTQKV